MIILKHTERSTVRCAFDGLVHKLYRGHHARQRLENEVHVLEHLRSRNCPFVPRLIEVDRANLAIVQSNCGVAVQRLSDFRLRQLFDSLYDFGVEHGDCELRNVTYRAMDGIFCIVDFEFASILEAEWSVQLDQLETQIENDLSEYC